MRLAGTRWFARTACAVVVFLCTGCRERYVEVPIEELEQRQPFYAVVERVYVEDFGKLPSGMVVVIGLKTEAGERICFGGRCAGEDVVGFARTLDKGRSYEFPTAWLDYRQRLKQ